MGTGGATLVLAALLIMAGCRSTDPLDPSFAGRTTAYEPGALTFDVEAEADSGGVVVLVAIPPVSLTFRREGAAFVARSSIELSLLNETTSERMAHASRVDTLRASSQEETVAYRPHLVRMRLAAPLGTYRLEVVLRDEGNGQIGRQAIRVHIPAPGTFALGTLHLDARLPGDTLRPLVSLHVPARLDTLRAAVVCSGVAPGTEATVTLHVVRFETDTLAADVPYGYTGLGSLAYRGVRLERADTVQTARQSLRGSSGRVTVEFGMPRLAPGLYRLVVSAQGVPGTHRQERLLAVKPSDFPRIRTLGEMVGALEYLLSRREKRRFADAATPEARREMFDRFWGQEVGNRDAATVRIRRYYDRVEEANLRFSGYKSGWKTDRGMLYVVLGPPLHVETWPDREIWYYSYNDRDARHTYVFERVRAYDDETPFDQFVLVRSGVHQRPWQRAVQAWRNEEE